MTEILILQEERGKIIYKMIVSYCIDNNDEGDLYGASATVSMILFTTYKCAHEH